MNQRSLPDIHTKQDTIWIWSGYQPYTEKLRPAAI